MVWNKLFVVEGLTENVKARIRSDSDIFRFKMLPFVALKAGHPWSSSPPPGLREISFSKTSYAVAWAINRALLETSHLARTWAPNGNRWVLGLDKPPQYIAMKDGSANELSALSLFEEVRIAHPAVISFSLQLRQRTKMTNDHILSIATRVAAKSLPVLVAAGNWGAFGAGTLSPLARLPWTIAVGATSDPEGTKLFQKSSIGEIGSKRGEGVTLVAYGENIFVPGEFGTSFAVPRVAEYILFLTSFILQLRAIEDTRRTGLLGGVPLLQYILIDSGFADFDPRPPLPLPMIPQLGVNRKAVNSTLDALHSVGLTSRIEPNPLVMRRMLIACAKAIDGYKPHEVGFGFVSQASTIEYLTQFTGLELAELFFEESNLDSSLRDTLRGCMLANPDELGSLYEIARRSSLAYSIDYRTREIHASMRDPGMDSRETGYRKEPSKYFWPPAI